MPKTGRSLTRYTPLVESTGGATKSTPSEGGRRVYKDVTLIKAGLGNQRDRNYYPAATLESAVERGFFEKLRAYADHQDSVSEEVQPERTIRDMVGIYHNPRWVKEGRGGRVVADLHLFKSSKWLSDTIDDLIDLDAADRIGLSINGRGRTVEKQIQLEEAGAPDGPVTVNWVEDFMVLRSGDVVTEAGAGGGFQQLLESAKGSKKETAMSRKLSEAEKTALLSAVEAGDTDKVGTILEECGCQMAEQKTAGKGKTAKAVAEAEEEADVDPLDQAAAEIKDASETDESGPEDVDGDDQGDDDDVAEDSDEDAGDDEGDVEEAYRGSGVAKGAGTFGVKAKGDGQGVHGKMLKGDKTTKGSFVKNAKSQGRNQAGRRYAEADLAAEVKALRAKNDRLMVENGKLSSQLRIRTTTDRARNLLRESSIPGKLQPEVLRSMVGKSENEMRSIIRYHERLIEAALDGRVDYDETVDNGSSMTEANYGARNSDQVTVTTMLSELGMPLRESK